MTNERTPEANSAAPDIASLRDRFLREWSGDDGENEFEFFAGQLAAIVCELPPRQKTNNKQRARYLTQFADALKKAAQYGKRLDGLSWLAIDDKAHLRVRNDVINLLDGTASKTRSSIRRLESLSLGSRASIATRHVLAVFRIFDLPVPDTLNSFAAECVGAVLAGMNESVSEPAIRSLIRRSKLGQK